MKKMTMKLAFESFVILLIFLFSASILYAETATYTYDNLNRLTRAVYTEGNQTLTMTYGYDLMGNRTSFTAETITDSDGDGIEDSLDPCPFDADNDIDGDGICGDVDDFPDDIAASVDTNGDGYPESWNPGYSQDDSSTGLLLASGDEDGDGVSNGAENVFGLDPQVDNTTLPDDDGDGIPDSYELAAGLDPFVANPYTSNIDNDPYSDYREYLYGLDPLNDDSFATDTDSDGLIDAIEDIIGTDPMVDDAATDTDNDGFSAAEEIELGTLPSIDNAAANDSDADGLPDSYEIAHGLDPNVSNIGLDSDNDTVLDVDEYTRVTDPLSPDLPSDGDVAPFGNRDGVVNVGDALICLRFALGLDIPTAEDVLHADVAPLDVNGQPDPDGFVTVGDALVILRKAVGLINF